MKRLMGLTLLMTVTMICAAIQFWPGGATRAATPGDDRIRATLDKIGWRYEVDKDGDFKVTMKTEDDRTQVVWIPSQTQKLGNFEIASIASVGYVSREPLEGKVANQLLMENGGKKLGAWEVLKSQKSHVAIFSTKVDINSGPDELKMAIALTAFSADGIEKSLTQADKF
jgi:hypothetical protein